MKKILPLFLTLFLSGSFFISCAQQKEKKEVKKEIRVEQENEGTTVTITETEDGKTTKRVLTGEDAENYLEEHDGSGQNSFSFSGDDEGGKHIVIVEEIESDGNDEHSLWVTDGDDDAQVKMIMVKNGTEDDVEKLLEDFDDLSKEEVRVRLEEMMENLDEMEKEMVVKMETLHEGHGNVKVNVEENDGIVTIEKTVDGKTTVETIKMDEENGSGNNIFIVKTRGDNDDEDVIITKKTASEHTNNLNMNVYPNPNKGSFTIDLDLQSEKEAKVNVVDADGNEVYNKEVKGAKSHKLEVKLKNSKKGMFIVTVRQGDTVMKSKIMID